MGQSLRRINRNQSSGSVSKHRRSKRHSQLPNLKTRFPDLAELPPELALAVLSNLNATDLCLAACVNDFWKELANDQLLWQGLCRATWGCVTAYERMNEPGFSWKTLYLQLDEASLAFSADPQVGLDYLFQHNLVDNDALAIAKFLHTTNRLAHWQVRQFLRTRSDVLEELVGLEDYANHFLPNALRTFFSHVQTPSERGPYLHTLIEMFARKFISCNPDCNLTVDTICVLCYSLMLLSIDLTSPKVKNKMSKREFIRNLRRATQEVDDELSGHLYDNIYLVGHIAPQKW
ncbi:F-box only protein 8-like [Anneissia japonica]|uniref:F-box only protein 8-like n=1 Tax=Anneissia japonica TaxID=1529436 RepID=UPI0014257ACB|nr:F-box only protein 8-like [Anneissia japonica]XP_033111881.1 F-box only protein 8-like [Anneissia japonica]